MKISRSIAAVVVGFIVSVLFIFAIEAVNGFVFPPPEGIGMMEWGEELQKGTPAAKAWIQSIPTSAHAMLQVGWAVGALVGGGVAALIAGRGRLVHAGIIGALVLLATIVNLNQLNISLDYVHPDWLIVTGLLLPLPMSLLAGKFVVTMFPPPPSPAPTETSI